MKRFFLPLIAIIVFNFSGSAQSIYRGLVYGMNVKDAKTEFKTNKDQYDNVDFGNGFAWRVYTQNLIYQNDSLVAILMTPKGAALGLSHDAATSYLEFSRAFFENKGYKLFFEPEYWQYPLNFHAKYGLLLSNSDKTIMVQLYPLSYKSGYTTMFTSCLKIMNYKWFMSTYEAGHKLLEKKSDESGF